MIYITNYWCWNNLPLWEFQKKRRKRIGFYRWFRNYSCAAYLPIYSYHFGTKRKRGVPRKIFGPTFDHLKRKSTITDGVMQISNNLSPSYFLFFARSLPLFLLIEPLWIYIFRIFPTADQNSSRSFVHVIRGPDVNATRFDSWHASPSFILYVNRTWIKVCVTGHRDRSHATRDKIR